MCAQLAYLQSSDAAEVFFDAIDRDGAVVIGNTLSKDELRALHDELDHHLTEAGFCEGLFYGSKTKRIHSLIAKSSTCRRMMMDRTVLDLTHHVLGPHCEKFQLNLTQGIQIWPGEKAQILHTDDNLFHLPVKPCEFMVNAMWAYSDFARENGATLVVPGSHKWERGRQAQNHEITCAEMKAGDVLVYVGSLLHGGGANISAAPRTGVVVSYCLGWLRQSENQYFAVPPNIARTLPKPVQDMLGYCVHRPNLGMYEGHEPNVLFSENPPKRLTHDWLTPDQQRIMEEYCQLHSS